MADGDFYHIDLTIDNVNGQQAHMVSYYRQNGNGSPAVDAGDLNERFRVFVANEIAELMSTKWVMSRCVVRNLLVPEDFSDVTFTNTGDLTSDALPAVLAVGLRSPRQKPGFNRSRHNLPLGDISWVDENGLITAAARTLIEDTMGCLGLAFWDVESSMTWVPVTVEIEYDDSVIVGVTQRSVVTGVWEYNSVFTTQKGRQDFFWLPVD